MKCKKLNKKTTSGSSCQAAPDVANAPETHGSVTPYYSSDSRVYQTSPAVDIARRRLSLAADHRSRAARAVALALLEIDAEEAGHG